VAAQSWVATPQPSRTWAGSERRRRRYKSKELYNDKPFAFEL